jgi:hypothetical protein
LLPDFLGILLNGVGLLGIRSEGDNPQVVVPVSVLRKHRELREKQELCVLN